MTIATYRDPPSPRRTDRFGAHLPFPPDLPRPMNDRACDHLIGMRIPRIVLPSTAGQAADLSALPAPTIVLYSYVSTAVPGRLDPHGWDTIPGARGGTAHSISFLEHCQEIAELGAEILGLSGEPTEHQKEMVSRLRLPFPVLSDSAFKLSAAMGLPTFELEGARYIKRFVLIVRGGVIRKVFYPVFPASESASRVIYWLRHNQPSG